MFSAAPAIVVVHTIHGFALDFQTVFRRLEQVAEYAAVVLVEAAAAGITFFFCRLSFHNDGGLAAAVFRVVDAAGHITV